MAFQKMPFFPPQLFPDRVIGGLASADRLENKKNSQNEDYLFFFNTRLP
jgi:hypothetical protein